MAIDATVQVLPTSVDTTGLSIVSSRKTLEAPRQGTIYNLDTFAAGIPVYFHPLQDGNYLALFRTRWTDTTPGPGPQAYVTYTSVSEPIWVVVNPATGQVGSVDTIPTRLSGYSTRFLNGACSRVDFLFSTGTVDDVGYLAMHRVSRDRSLLLQSEETLPVTPGGVTLGYGCYLDGNYLVVFGLDADGAVCQARKQWSRVGVNTSTDYWFYRGERGWLADPEYLSPITDPAGPITSVGPVSVGWFRDRMWASTVRYAEGDHTVQVYSVRPADAWKPDGDPILLATDPEYPGGGLFFQSQLPANPALYPEGVTAAIPYVTSRIDRNYPAGEPVYVGVSNAQEWISANTMVTSRPTGTTDGDLLIAVVSEHNIGTAPTPPADWELVGSVAATSPAIGAMRLYTKTASSEPSTYTWGLPNPHSATITIVAVRYGVIADHAFTVATGPTGTPTAPSVSADGGLLLCFLAARSYTDVGGVPTFTSVTGTPPTGMTEIVDACGGETWAAAAVLVDPDYGPTGAREFTASVPVGATNTYPFTLSVAVVGKDMQYAMDTAWRLWATA